MAQTQAVPFKDYDEDEALKVILEGTATRTGSEFFKALVETMARALKTHGAWVAEFREETRELRPLALWMGGKFVPSRPYPIPGTPCEVVIRETRLVHFPDRVIELFPGDTDIQKVGAVSYMGVPLLDLNGRILGHLAVLDLRPMPEEPRSLALFQIFAARAAAELQRLRAEGEVREREEALGRVFDGAMDAILQLDPGMGVVRMNPAAEKLFGRGDKTGQADFGRYLAKESRDKLQKLIRELHDSPGGRRSLWIPGGLKGRFPQGDEFPAEATLSRFEMGRGIYYTLILRNVNERLEAERKIRSLTDEAAYLREEIREIHHYDEIIGDSPALLSVLRDVEEVAGADTTVLIQGETGTGKEVIARAVHSRSRRRDKPLIKVNCAAIPETLIESEFFGHEKGAFTGATQKREGRFALADGGTIFLDEVGELPKDLQPKLLRVLQEGEFEPVGSSRTRKVDVRVLAATNRDLERAVKEGGFREDLFYRLNVFPVRIPPLRERPGDIPLLAEALTRRFAHKIGRNMEPLSPVCIEALQRYGWPGNVRELENVIERAVITSRDGRLNLDRAFPEGRSEPRLPTVTASVDEKGPGVVRTAAEMEALEKENLIRALKASGWKVTGRDGAAKRLGLNPSTLNSRMKALGIRRPPKD